MIAYAVEGTPVPLRSLRLEDARRYAGWFEWVDRLPLASTPQLRDAWAKVALGEDELAALTATVLRTEVVDAILALEMQIDRGFRERFGDARSESVQRDYLAAVFHQAADDLPHRHERADPRWFAWALHIEACFALIEIDEQHPRRCLMLAGIATGCPVDFAWQNRGTTRPEYRRDATTVAMLHRRGMKWATDFEAARAEVHALFGIHERGR